MVMVLELLWLLVMSSLAGKKMVSWCSLLGAD